MSPATLKRCESNQVEGQLRDVQGATGNWAAAFWFADVSTGPCRLDPPVHIDLLNSSGGTELSLSDSFPPIAVTGDTQLPPPDSNGSGQMADITLFWPTAADVAASENMGGGDCPTAVLDPAAIRFTFAGSTSVIVPNQSEGRRSVEVCGRRISVVYAGAT